MPGWGQGVALPLAAALRNLADVYAAILAILALFPLAAGEAPTRFTFVETVAGRPAPASDRAAVEGLRRQHTERLARARAELPTATPTLARVIRTDILALEAEIERLAVLVGGELRVGQRVYFVRPDLIAVEADGIRLEVDPATGRGRLLGAGGGEATPVEMAAPPEPLPLARGTPGPAVAGRATLRFVITADGREYVALVDPTLPNPLARLVPRDREDTALTLELARLPGMPLDISFDNGDFVRRFTYVKPE